MTQLSFLRSSAVIAIAAWIGLAVALSAGGYLLASDRNGSPSSGSPATIEVTASATVSTTPDTLTVDLAVTTHDASSATALNRNDAEMHHLQQVFLSAGVKKSDLATTNLSVAATFNDKGQPNGFGAEDDLEATLHVIAKAGAVIDAAQNAVGNDVSINSIAFSISNSSHALARARIQAMQNARTSAQAFATGGGELLGPIAKISETQVSVPTPFAPTFGAAASGVARSPVPIQAGTQQVSAHVDVIYDLNR